MALAQSLSVLHKLLIMFHSACFGYCVCQWPEILTVSNTTPGADYATLPKDLTKYSLSACSKGLTSAVTWVRPSS